jgi:hypothetical protein
MQLYVPRQMLWQRFAGRTRSALDGCFRRIGSNGLGLVGLQLFELQFELLNLPIDFLRFAAKLSATQNEYLQLQCCFDLQLACRGYTRTDRKLILRLSVGG